MTFSGSSGISSYDGGVLPITSPTGLTPSEWKAIKMFLIGVVPLFLIPLPIVLFYFSFHLFCQHNYSTSVSSSSNGGGQQQLLMEQCTDGLSWLIPYMFYLLISLHSLVNPITSFRLN